MACVATVSTISEDIDVIVNVGDKIDVDEDVVFDVDVDVVFDVDVDVVFDVEVNESVDPLSNESAVSRYSNAFEIESVSFLIAVTGTFLPAGGLEGCVDVVFAAAVVF